MFNNVIIVVKIRVGYGTTTLTAYASWCARHVIGCFFYSCETVFILPLFLHDISTWSSPTKVFIVLSSAG